MPSTIESRIVSMVFDNKEFEKNVATSQKTISDLNKSLEFKDADKNFRNLENASKSVTFSEMKTSIGEIAVKMKASTVIGIELLKDLTHTALNFAKTWTSKVIDPIASGGWNRAANIENAKFQLAGLGIAWEEVSNDIDYGVKDTAYGLDAAAKAASQLAASGVEFGEVFGDTGNSPMAKALRGISGVAAMTNSSYEDISQIFTKIAGNGRVMGDELQRLSSRGMNAAATLADYFNDVLGGNVDNVSDNVKKAIQEITGGTKVAENDIREFVSDGLISFDIFSEAMNTTFGDHAKDANKTFDGALSNMKAALSRIGAEFATSYRSNMIEVYNALRASINDIKKVMGPVFETADAIMTDMQERFVGFVTNFDNLLIKGGAFKHIFAGIADLMEGAYELITTIADTISSTFEMVVPKMTKVDELVMTADEFANNFKADRFVQAVKPFEEMAKRFKEMVQSEDFIAKLVTGVRTVIDIFNNLFGIVKNIKDAIFSMVEHFTRGFKISTIGVDKSLFSILGILDKISEAILKIRYFFGKQDVVDALFRLKSVMYTVGEAFGVVFNNIQKSAGKISEAWKKIFPSEWFSKLNIGYYFGQIIGRIEALLYRLRLTGDQATALGKGFENFFNVLKVGKKIFNVIAEAVGVVIVNILSLWKAAKDAFFEIFDGSGVSDFATRLNQVIYTIQRFIQNLMFSDTAIENFKRAFAGIFAVVSIVKDIFVATFSVIARVFNNIMGDVTRNTDNAIDGISGFIGRIGDWLVSVKEWLEEHEVFEKAADFMAMAIGKMLNFFRDLVGWIKRAWEMFDAWVEKVTGSSVAEHFDNIGTAVQNAWDKIKGFFSKLAGGGETEEGEKKVSKFAGLWEKIKTAFEKLSEGIEKAWPTIESILGNIIDMMGDIFSGIGNLFGGIGGETDGAEAVKGVGVLLGGIGAFKLGSGSKGALSAFTDCFSSLTETLKMAQDRLKIDTVKAIATAIMEIAGSVLALALVDSDKLWNAVAAMGAIVLEFKKFAVMISQLASDMGKSGIRDFNKTAKALIELAAALLVISFTVKSLGKMDTVELGKGLAAVYVIIKELGIAVESFSKNEKSIVGTCAGLILLALAMDLLIIPVKQFGKMDVKSLAKGVGTIGALLLELAIAMKLFAGNRVSDLLAAASTILILSTAMLLLTIPMKVFATMEWEEIGKGLVAIGGLLLEFVLAVKLMSGGGAIAAAVTVSTLAVAMLLLIAPMEAFAHMDWMQIAKGLVAVGGLLLEFVLVTKLLKGGSAMGAAITVIALALALNMLIVPLKAFGSMSWAEIGKGLLVIAGAFGVLIVAGYAAAPVVVIIVALAAAMLLLGAAIALAGAGLLEVALAMTMMTALGPGVSDLIKSVLGAVLSLIPQFVAAVISGLQVLVAGIFGIIETILVGFFTMIPQVVSGVLELLSKVISIIVEYLPQILEHFPTIVEAFFFMLKTIVQKFAEVAPELFDALGIILRHFLQMLNDVAPDFWAFVATTLLGIIQVIRETAPALIETIFEIVLKILEELSKNMADIVNLLIDTLVTLLETLTTRLPELSLAVVEFIIGLINSVADTIMEKAPEIRDAIANLIGSIIKMVLELFGIDTSNMENNKFQEIGKFLLGGFIGGIVDKFPEFWNKIKEFFKKIGEWFKGKFEEFKGFGKRILEGLRDGVKEKFEEVKEKITGFFDKIGGAVKKLFGINSPSTYFKDVGKYIMQGFQNGADQEHTGVMDKVKGFFGKIGQGVKDLFGIDKEDGMFTGIGKKIMSAFKNAVSDSSGDTESEVTGVFSKVTESAAGAEEQFSSVGAKLMHGLNVGMANQAPESVKVVLTVLDGTANAASGYYGTFYQIGVQMVNGLANGMRANKPIANRSSQEMANELATIARQTLGINSPSKVFAEIGMGCDEGMAKGILAYTDLVDKAGTEVADTAVNSASMAVAAIANSLVDDMGGDPVIRPVLDLTEIENGTQRIANMFDDPTYSAMNPFFMGGYIDQTVAPIKMGTGSGVNTTSNTTNNNAAINISVNAAKGQNAEEIADAVQKRLKMSLDQRGYAFR